MEETTDICWVLPQLQTPAPSVGTGPLPPPSQEATGMSFVRVNRAFASRGGSKRVIKVKKRKPSVKQDWDCTVHDLTVHRATPEDLVRRHEIHKSKNHGLAQWELRERTLKKRWKKRQDPPDVFEKKRLAIMREALFDQYQLSDVLERSDQAIGAVKDLFGDAPRRRTGFPNVTVAPHCDLDTSQGPITQKPNPPTQLSILSESVMDSQALNEVNHSSSHTPSEQSLDVRDISVSIYSNVSADRMLHFLQEENSMLAAQLQEDNQSQVSTRSSVLSLVTPTKPAEPASSGETALNATAVVQKTRSRLRVDEPSHSSESPSIGQVLNPRPPKNPKRATPQGSKKSLQAQSFFSLFDMSSMEPPKKSQSSLDVLNNMIQEVEKEMGDYEQQTGRTVMASQGKDGITGFTLSLVNSLSRLVRYLKEGELHLKRELEERKRLEDELRDHRMLIDALTSEIMVLREENSCNQFQLQTIATDEQLLSLTQGFRGVPGIESTTIFHCQQDPNSCTIDAESKSKEPAAVHKTVSRTSLLEAPMEIKVSLVQESLGNQRKASPPEVTPSLSEVEPTLSQEVFRLGGPRRGRSLPAHVFEPAVMLSPPRQKNTLEDSANDIRTHPAAITVPTPDTKKLEYQETKSSSAAAEAKMDECRFFAERWILTHTLEEGKNTFVGPRSASVPLTKTISQRTVVDRPQTAAGAIPNGDERGSPSEENVCDEELVAKIADLTMQNSFLKAKLVKSKVDTHAPEAGEGQQQLLLVHDATATTTTPAPISARKFYRTLCTSQVQITDALDSRRGDKQDPSKCIPQRSEGEDANPRTPEIVPPENSLECRIAELNRQSTEARKKLLQLIDQQKQATAASPPISPIPLQPAWTGSKGKTIEVSIPGLEPADSSIGQTPSPASRANLSGRSSSSFMNWSYSPRTPPGASQKTPPVALRPKNKHQTEEGWFALSTHVM
ncbi:spindle and centriole-associated protein 1 isoform X3 [Ambystoma mexicanum]|uniref:spindle and centriole-associated protein 1 isoform X3 n=1 Tax=Ambystoma mexicanum TaxID=8296 RepID=UPI0037E9BF6F